MCICLQVLTLSMEDVIDATGAGSRKGRAALPGTNSEILQERQVQDSPSYLFEAGSVPFKPKKFFSKAAGSVSFKPKKVPANKDCRPKQALPGLTGPAAGLLSTDTRISSCAAVNDIPHMGSTLSGQSNYSSRCLRLDQVREQLGLGIGGSTESDWKMPYSCSCSCSSTSVGVSQMGQPELLGRCPRNPRRVLRRETQCRGGNMTMLRGRGLARAVLCKLEKAGVLAQARQPACRYF